MLKTKAIELLGGTVDFAAAALGISSQTFAQWPGELPRPMAERVLAASNFPPIVEMPVPPGWDGVDRRELRGRPVPPELDRRTQSNLKP